ncbi:MAG: DUF3035 domain-containing protein [Rhodospirillum sp.]|nr:DUF3035 domain-containing protein [Rhodospirillum sp.]MCF8489291.1 DUF3035 domain-containing protein [Rhodospirillum sp.]
MTASCRIVLAAVLALPLALGACDNAKKQLGLERNAPDEFKVVTRAPLALPPDFNLRPPEPGAARPQEMAPRDSARTALLGEGSDMSTGLTSGEQALLGAAETDRAIPNIRDVVNRETSSLAAEDKTFTEKLVFWRKNEEDRFGTTVDPDAENQRLRQNQSLGRPVTEGRTPTIERRQRGILEGIF